MPKAMDSDMYYLDENKNAIPTKSAIEWGQRFKRQDRVVKQSKLPGARYLSTVFLGIDHSYGGNKPLLFESMLFPGNDLRRYSTWAEALAGHEEWRQELIKPKTKKKI
jgi:hypothetical protein